jgi:hypothetical protein
LVEGLEVALKGMQEGELAEVTVLPSMGYGRDVAQGPLAEIPPFSVLFYTIKLHWVEQVPLPIPSRIPFVHEFRHHLACFCVCVSVLLDNFIPVVYILLVFRVFLDTLCHLISLTWLEFGNNIPLPVVPVQQILLVLQASTPAILNSNSKGKMKTPRLGPELAPS